MPYAVAPVAVSLACVKFVKAAKLIPLIKAATGGQFADIVGDHTDVLTLNCHMSGVIAIPVAKVDHRLVWALPLVDSPTMAGFLKPFHNF